jgi:hypothetical protein
MKEKPFTVINKIPETNYKKYVFFTEQMVYVVFKMIMKNTV